MYIWTDVSEQTELITADYSKQRECDFQVNEITCVDTLTCIVRLDKLKLGCKNEIP